MKYIVISILCFVFIRDLLAQPSWVTDAIKKSENATVDDEATEHILFHTTEIIYNKHGRANIIIRHVNKLYKFQDTNYDIFVELIHPNRTIHDILGWKISPNSEIEILEEKNIVEVSYSTIQAYYDEDRYVKGVYRNVRAGDIIAYEYEIEDNDWTKFHQNYFFQIQQPVFFSQFSVELPIGWKLNKSEWNLDNIHFIQKEAKYIWTAYNLQFQPEEQLMPPWSFVSKHVTVNVYNPEDTTTPHFANWTHVSQWIAELSEVPTMYDSTINEIALRLTKNLNSTDEKIRVLSDFVREQIRYVAVEVGIGRWKPHNASFTLNNKFGDCKDKTTLLRSLLRVLNIPSYFTLANTSFYVNPNFPTPFQFNHVIISIPDSVFSDSAKYKNANSGGWVFFDPTDEATPLGILPARLQGTIVLLAHKADSSLVQLPYTNAEMNYRAFRGNISYGTDGTIVGFVSIVEKGTFKHYIQHIIENLSKKEQTQGLQRLLSSNFQTVEISDLQTSATTDSFCTSFNFIVEQKLNYSGETIILKPNIFNISDITPLTRKIRIHPIWFGGPRVIETDFLLELPSSWKPKNELPTLTTSCLDVAHLSYKIYPQEDKLHYKSRQQYSGWLLKSEDYVHAKVFSRAIRSLSNLTLIIQQK